jgi:hypothetical protein
MGFGVLAFGVAMGALLAVAFAVACGRVGSVRPRALAVRIAAAAYVVVCLVPFVKYPPNPPSVGRAETISQRTGLFLLMMAVSLGLAIAGVWLARRIVARLGVWNATLVSAGAYLVTIAIVMLVLPPVNETPQGFPADDLYAFRLSSLGTQLVLWGATGLAFAHLAARLLKAQNRGATILLFERPRPGHRRTRAGRDALRG